MWIELGIFVLVFIFAYFQLKELKREKIKREREQLPLNSSEVDDK